jgi:hypothetical protein
MAFDTQGNYTGSDEPTRHVAVATKSFLVGRRGPHQFPVAAGTVTLVRMWGQTQLSPLAEPMLNGPQMMGNMAWIEHATANVGDVLPMDEVTPAIVTAKTKQEAIAKYRAAEAAKPKPPPVPALTAEEVVALRSLIAKPAT